MKRQLVKKPSKNKYVVSQNTRILYDLISEVFMISDCQSSANVRNQAVLVEIQVFHPVLLKKEEGGLLTSIMSFLRECVYMFQYHLLTLVWLKRDFKSIPA